MIAAAVAFEQVVVFEVAEFEIAVVVAAAVATEPLFFSVVSHLNGNKKLLGNQLTLF